jgi:acyl transferase domain-containing protein
MWDWFIYSGNGILTPDLCKPFDSAADGYVINSTLSSTLILTPTITSFVRGEGAAAIVIKPLEAALADNDHIYAVVRFNLFLAYPSLITPR